MLSPRGYKPLPKFVFKVHKDLSDNQEIKGVLELYAKDFEDAYSEIKACGFKIVEQVQTEKQKPFR